MSAFNPSTVCEGTCNYKLSVPFDYIVYFFSKTVIEIAAKWRTPNFALGRRMGNVVVVSFLISSLNNAM